MPTIVRSIVLASCFLAASISSAQPSIGRGAPDPMIPELLVGTETKGYWAAAGIPEGNTPIVAAQDGDIPGGVTPLPVNVFNSSDFYLDEEYWFDPRYYLCNSPSGLEQIWGAYEVALIGDNPPDTAPWGHCDRDYPREEIVSPYPFTSAAEHYDALIEESRQRGGPTRYTQATLPDWNGRYPPTCHCCPLNTRCALSNRCFIIRPPMPRNGPAHTVGLKDSCAGLHNMVAVAPSRSS